MQMDETTQQNAALVEETTSASQSMKEQARELTKQIASFKISGSKQEDHTGLNADPSAHKSSGYSSEQVKKPPFKKQAELLTDAPEPVGFSTGNGKNRSQKDSEFEESYENDPIEREHIRDALKLGESILEATIGALDSPAAIMVPETTSIRAAIQTMIEHHIGAVLVERGGRMVGIFTERDVLRRVVISGIDFARVVVDSASVRAVHGGKKRDRARWTAGKTAASTTSWSTPAAPRWRRRSPAPTATT